MRPHLLELTAFGPFAGSEAVCFDELAEAGLFLLHGETGAGKTTLLDAVCFALYGSVPGERQRAARPRSDHAAPSVPTSVRFDVTFGSQRLRITRSPAWERPKKRGQGTTQVNAAVLLERYENNGWSTVTTRWEEAGDEIKDAVGMSAAQFFQVVLLPQGGFAKFLQSGVDERADLLQKLFGTERFENVERWLKARRSASETALSGQQQVVRELTAAIAQAAGAQAVTDDERDVVTSADELRAGAKQALAQAERSVLRAAGEVAKATTERDALTRRIEQGRARAEIAVQITGLERRQDEIDALAREISAARKAAPLAPLLRALDETARTAKQAAALASETRHVTEFATATSRYSLDAEATPADLAMATSEAQQRLGTLIALQPLADAVAEELRAARGAEQQGLELGTTIELLCHEHDSLPGLLTAADEQLSVARTGRLAVERLRAEVRDLERASALAAVRDESARELAKVAETITTMTTSAQDARQSYLDLQLAYIDGLAARLAVGLGEDDPCPVCGGLEHPNPAAPDTSAVDKLQVDEAEAGYEWFRAQLETLEQHRGAMRVREQETGDQLRAAGREADTEADLRAAVDAASSALADATRHAAGLAEAESAHTRLANRQTELAQSIARIQAEAVGADRRAAEARSRADAQLAQLVAELGPSEDLAAAIQTARQTAAALETAADAARTAQDAAHAHDAAARACAQAIATSGFDDPAAAHAAVRPETWIEQQEHQRNGHQQELAHAQARLADLGADDVPLAELTGFLGTADELLSERQAAHAVTLGNEALCRNRSHDLDRLVPQLHARSAAMVPIEAEHRLVTDVSELVEGRGANYRKMALSSYVLAARLEEVAAAASDRLVRMTDGRYTLVHSDVEAEGQQRRRGLSLRVRDAWTGQDRDTRTLSGGETFLASLALALGLADVVKAESGGTQIDTLFVDEGFGSLDENTLDEVMDVLDQLRAGGRLVGLVSHVAELKLRIPTRLEVRKSRAGSTVVSSATGANQLSSVA